MEFNRLIVNCKVNRSELTDSQLHTKIYIDKEKYGDGQIT